MRNNQISEWLSEHTIVQEETRNNKIIAEGTKISLSKSCRDRRMVLRGNVDPAGIECHESWSRR